MQSAYPEFPVESTDSAAVDGTRRSTHSGRNENHDNDNESVRDIQEVDTVSGTHVLDLPPVEGVSEDTASHIDDGESEHAAGVMSQSSILANRVDLEDQLRDSIQDSELGHSPYDAAQVVVV